MNIKTFRFNAFSENTYLIWDEANIGAIIDPGCSNFDEENQLVEFISKENIDLKHHLLTHAHIDHGEDIIRFCTGDSY